MSVASSLEYICHHESQKPAVFVAAAIPPQTRQAIVKATKAKAGSNTSQTIPSSARLWFEVGCYPRACVEA